MDTIILNFFGEKEYIKYPKCIVDLRKIIEEKFLFSTQDASEIIIYYENDNVKNFIETENDLISFIRSKVEKQLYLDINESSKLFKEEVKNEEKERNLRNQLENLKKEKKDLLEAWEQKSKGVKKELNEIKEVIKELKQNYLTKHENILKEYKNISLIIKEKNEKIKEIQNKLKLNCENSKQNINEVIEENKIIKPDKIEEVKKELAKDNKKEEVKEEYKNLNLYNPKTIINNNEEKDIKEDEEKVIHENTRCRGCGANPIRGIRYKCPICNDFDYCEECEEKYGEIHQHPFIKIIKPYLTPISINCTVDENPPKYLNLYLDL